LEIGPKLAGQIIAHRPYHTVEGLSQGEGIGPKMLEKLRPLVEIRWQGPAGRPPTRASRGGWGDLSIYAMTPTATISLGTSPASSALGLGPTPQPPRGRRHQILPGNNRTGFSALT
jgi:hypothetical protein